MWGRVRQASCCHTPACVGGRVHVQTRAFACSLLPTARAQARLQRWEAAAWLLRPLPLAPSEEAAWAVLLSPPVGPGPVPSGPSVPTWPLLTVVQVCSSSLAHHPRLRLCLVALPSPECRAVGITQ